MLGCIWLLLKPSSQECGGGRETGSSNLLSTWVTSPCLSDKPSIRLYHTGNKTIFLRGKEAFDLIVNPFTYSLPMNVESVSKGRVSVAPECFGHNWASFAEADIPSRVERYVRVTWALYCSTWAVPCRQLLCMYFRRHF